jgi:hypothetical protein
MREEVGLSSINDCVKIAAHYYSMLFHCFGIPFSIIHVNISVFQIHKFYHYSAIIPLLTIY